ncbi:MAG: polysaccharide biosynthesis tyrosine autokinase [Elusimicrobia bacterium]|nr:polysaccharide biosynthesis tyrosine autokinase [Elusimicrobiota bacterium]
MPFTERPQDQPEVDLNELIARLSRRRWVIAGTWLAVVAAGIIHLATTTPVYEASAMLNIEKERGSGAIYINNGAFVESKNEDYYQTQYNLLRRYSLIEKVHRDLDMSDHPEFGGPSGVAALVDAVRIVPVPKSRLVHVKASSRDPETASRIANAIAETFTAENLSHQLFISRDVLQALQAESGSAKGRKLYESLPNVVNSSLIQGLKGDYFKLESQAAELSQKVTPKHPAMIALKSNMAALRTQIGAETERIVGSLKAELSGQLRGNNVRVVEPARAPTSPSRPQRKTVIPLTVFGGMALALCVGLLVDGLDQSVRGEKDVEEKLRLPFLGLIPQGRRRSGERIYQHILSKEQTFSGESFRGLRTMVEFAGVGGKAKAMLVTSALEQEGKSFISANLAVTFATMGEEVLLIDGDLRRPSLHKVLGLPLEKGLSDFLAAGQNASEVQALLKTTEVPGLKVLTCGTRPPNPSELLNTPRVAALLAWAASHFDRVVVDTAPILPIHDTLLWARHAPSAVIVVRYGKTRASAAQSAARKAHAAGCKVLGAVVNAARPTGLAYPDRYHYYHSYHGDAEKAESSSGREAQRPA